MIEKKFAIVALGLILFAGVVIGIFLPNLSFAVADLSDAVWCNGYEWISCGIAEGTMHNVDLTKYSVKIGAIEPFRCPYYKCVLSQGGIMTVGVGNCKVGYYYGVPYYWDCDSTRNDTVAYKGEAIIAVDSYEREFYYKDYKERLAWCGLAACDAGTSGREVWGADGCTYTLDQTVYDEQGRLLHTRGTGQYALTVPTNSSFKVVSTEWRHICGSKSESCSIDSECWQHPYSYGNGINNAECTSGSLNIYGCRQYSEKECLEYDCLTESCVQGNPTDADKCLQYSPNLNRCEVIQQINVQCCPGTCGTGVCDTTTWTCTQPEQVECNYNWECGTEQVCDRESKQLKEWRCINNKCNLSVLQSVQCCYDVDCASGWYCSAPNYTCKESDITKRECPYECCVNEHLYFDKPAPPGKVCCPTGTDRPHTIANSLNECSEGTAACAEYIPDGFWILQYIYTQPEWWQMLFLGAQPQCVPIYNLPLIVLIISIAVAVILAIIYLRKK
jgi:hypothetical protein